MIRISLAISIGLTIAGCGGGGARISVGTMPPGGSYHGQFQSPQYGNMHLCVSGSHVVGDYEKDERRGRIQGTIQGDVLRFQWEEERAMVVGRTQTTRGRGYFRLTIGGDGDQYIQGEWGHDDAETGGGPWNGVKLRRRRPDRCAGGAAGTSGGDEEEDDYGDDGGDYEDDGGDYEDDGGDSGDDGGGDPALEGLDEF